MKRSVVAIALAAVSLALALAGAAVGKDWLLWVLHALSRWLLALPEPAATSADIVKAFAWPLVLLYFLSRYRGQVRRILDTLVERFKKDRLKAGPFEMTANSEVIALKPADAAQSTAPHSPEDVERMSGLFEFIAEPANRDTLASWIKKNVDPNLDIRSFLTSARYGTQREQAYQQLISQAPTQE